MLHTAALAQPPARRPARPEARLTRGTHQKAPAGHRRANARFEKNPPGAARGGCRHLADPSPIPRRSSAPLPPARRGPPAARGELREAARRGAARPLPLSRRPPGAMRRTPRRRAVPLLTSPRLGEPPAGGRRRSHAEQRAEATGTLPLAAAAPELRSRSASQPPAAAAAATRRCCCSPLAAPPPAANGGRHRRLLLPLPSFPVSCFRRVWNRPAAGARPCPAAETALPPQSPPPLRALPPPLTSGEAAPRPAQRARRQSPGGGGGPAVPGGRRPLGGRPLGRRVSGGRAIGARESLARGGRLGCGRARAPQSAAAPRAPGRAAELRGKRTERGGGRHAQREARPRQPRARRPPRANGRAAPRGDAFPDGGNARKAAVVSRGAGGGRPGPTRAAPRGQGVPGRELRSKPS